MWIRKIHHKTSDEEATAVQWKLPSEPKSWNDSAGRTWKQVQ